MWLHHMDAGRVLQHIRQPLHCNLTAYCHLQDTICVRVCVMWLDHVAAGQVLQRVCHFATAVPDKWGGIYQRMA